MSLDTSKIIVGGPCKITDNGNVIYTVGDVTLEPQPVNRALEQSVTGANDSILTDLVWKARFTPKQVYSALYRGVLFPTALYNFATAGVRLIGAANRAVTILGSDGSQYILNRAALTKMPSLFLGLGKDIYGDAEYTAFIKTAAAPTDADAFYTQSNNVAWDQSDFPAGHQEALCTAAWGAVAGWSPTIYAEDGFTLTHDLKLDPIKQGNITVDYRVNGYRGMMGFKPQGPTEAQVLTALGLQGANLGIGRRLSANTADLVVTGSGISVTLSSCVPQKGGFVFSNKVNRLGEIGFITAVTGAPATRLTLA